VTQREGLPLKSASGSALRWFLVCELLCVSGFSASLGLGNTRLALVFLLGPFQVLAWLIALHDSSYALALFAALLPAAGMELLPTPYHRYVYFPAALILFFVVTRGFLANGRGIGRQTLDRLDTIPLALVGVSLVLATANAVVHGWARGDLWLQAVLLVEAMVLLYFFAVAPMTTTQVRTIILAFCFTLSATVIIARLLSILGGGSETLIGGIVSKGGLNVLGAFLSCGAALLLGVSLQADKASTRVIMLLCMAVVLITLILTKSRGAWFGFGAAVLYALLRVRSGWLWTVVVLSVLVLLGVGSLRHVLLSRAGETSEGDPSFLGRVILWSYAWKIIKANWLFGVGFDNFRYVKHFYGYPGNVWWIVRFHSHNIILEMLADLGVVGFIGCCWLYVRTLVRLDRVVRAKSPDRWALALGLGAALVAYGAHGLFDFVAWHYGALALLAVLLGLGINAGHLDSSAAATRGRVV
jgi:O-antigen ligase